MSVLTKAAETLPDDYTRTRPRRSSGLRSRSTITFSRAEPRVLVVDDQSSICELLSIYLSQKGFEVATVQSADEARPLLERGAFNLVILDWKLGGIEGLDLLQLSKRRHPKIPVIIYTGADVAEVPFQGGLAHEADEVVRKMGPLDCLCAAIFRHLEPAYVHAFRAA